MVYRFEILILKKCSICGKSPSLVNTLLGNSRLNAIKSIARSFYANKEGFRINSVLIIEKINCEYLMNN